MFKRQAQTADFIERVIYWASLTSGALNFSGGNGSPIYRCWCILKSFEYLFVHLYEFVKWYRKNIFNIFGRN